MLINEKREIRKHFAVLDNIYIVRSINNTKIFVMSTEKSYVRRK